MVQARDEGLIAGVGLSNVSLEQLRHAADRTEIACVQNLFHLADRGSAPVLAECVRRGIAFVPFCPLGLPRGAANPVLNNPAVIRTAARLGVLRRRSRCSGCCSWPPTCCSSPAPAPPLTCWKTSPPSTSTLDDEALRELATG